MATREQIIDRFIDGPAGRSLHAEIERDSKRQELAAAIAELKSKRTLALAEPEQALSAATERWHRANEEVKAAGEAMMVAQRQLSLAKAPFYRQLTTLEAQMRSLDGPNPTRDYA